MKQFRKILVICACFFLAQSIFAQLNLGAGLSAIRVAGYGTGMYGLSLRGDFLLKEEYPVYVVLNTYLPRKRSLTSVIQPLSSASLGTPNID